MGRPGVLRCAHLAENRRQSCNLPSSGEKTGVLPLAPRHEGMAHTSRGAHFVVSATELRKGCHDMRGNPRTLWRPMPNWRARNGSR